MKYCTIFEKKLKRRSSNDKKIVPKKRVEEVFINIWNSHAQFLGKLSVIRPLHKAAETAILTKGSDSAFKPHKSLSNVSDSWSDMTVRLTLCRLTF